MHGNGKYPFQENGSLWRLRREENEAEGGYTEGFGEVDGYMVSLTFQVETPGGGGAAPVLQTYCFFFFYQLTHAKNFP